jgi:aerobic C4-dicarboxylate transport protein
VQVLIAVALGVLVGYLFPNKEHPEVATLLKPLGDAFIKMIKLLIAPIIFCTIVHGIASVGDMRKLGYIGIKSLVYFEVVSTLALVIGLVVVNLLQPGVGVTDAGASFHIDSAKSAEVVASYTVKAKEFKIEEFLLHIIPSSFMGAFVSGDLLQVLFISLLTAIALSTLGEIGRPILEAIDRVGTVFFAMMRLVVKFAPIGAFGAMGYAIAMHGVDTLGNLIQLMAGFYITAGLFVVVVLGSIMRWCGVSIFSFLYYIREELLLVLGTSSSETALPGLMEKMQRLGCSKSTVGLVGYSFNLDGTNIYLAMAAVFIAQATNTPMSIGSQVLLLLIAMLTSKGASGVTGAGFITLAATLQAVPSLPIEAMGLLFGIDRFMSECRALTNFIGNSVATVAICRWEGELTAEQLREKLISESVVSSILTDTGAIVAGHGREGESGR